MLLAAHDSRAQEAQVPSLAPANVFFSQAHWFRIFYPDGVERHYIHDDIPATEYERENFEIKSPDGASLYGRVSAKPEDTASPDQLVETSLESLKNGRFRNSRESEGWAEGQRPPPFRVTLRVVKSDWYAYSGIQGSTIFYEKALTGPSVRRVHMQYPIAAKRYFDPIVARIANSLEPYLYFRALVWMSDRRKTAACFGSTNRMPPTIAAPCVTSLSPPPTNSPNWSRGNW